MSDVKIIECDFNNKLHTRALVLLINHYISDKMGSSVPLNDDKESALIEGLKNHPSRLILLAVSEGTYAGLIVSFINFATFTAKPFINIHDIVVLDKYRNQGIGRKLLEEIHRLASELNCSKLTLEVREDNLSAQHLYKSMGYIECKPLMYFWEKTLQ